ncbi:MAG: hypothetical protein QW035_02275 [Candidatus Anstonellales archaeon]
MGKGEEIDETKLYEMAKKATSEGALFASLYLDIHGADEKKLQNVAVELVNRMMKEQGVLFVFGKIEEPILQEGVYSTLVEVKAIVADINSLATLTYVYTPVSVDLIMPDEVKLTSSQVGSLMVYISNQSFNWKKIYIERMRTKEEAEAFAKEVQAREQLGKKLLEGEGK